MPTLDPRLLQTIAQHQDQATQAGEDFQSLPLRGFASVMRGVENLPKALGAPYSTSEALESLPPPGAMGPAAPVGAALGGFGKLLGVMGGVKPILTGAAKAFPQQASHAVHGWGREVINFLRKRGIQVPVQLQEGIQASGRYEGYSTLYPQGRILLNPTDPRYTLPELWKHEGEHFIANNAPYMRVPGIAAMPRLKGDMNTMVDAMESPRFHKLLSQPIGTSDEIQASLAEFPTAELGYGMSELPPKLLTDLKELVHRSRRNYRGLIRSEERRRD